MFRGERQGNLAPDEAEQVLGELFSLPIEYSWDPEWLPRARRIALRFRQPNIFDAIYLVCADDLRCDLWTCDRKFVASFGALRPTNLKLCPDDVEAVLAAS